MLIGPDVYLQFGNLSFLFYAGLFLSVGEICNMIGVALTVPIANALGRNTYLVSFAALIALSIAFFYVPLTRSGYGWMLALQVVISIFTGIISPLVWSMYADVSDFAEERDGTASTALIFSSASMAQKFGGAVGGAAVMWLLGLFGYNTAAGAVQTPEAVFGLKLLMSWFPALVALVAVLAIFFYPLTTQRMEKIQADLADKRGLTSDRPQTEQTVEEGGGKGNGLARTLLLIIGAILILELAFILFKDTEKGVPDHELPGLRVEGTVLKSTEDGTCSMFTPAASTEGPWSDDVIKPWGKTVKAWLKEAQP